jgi:Tfp pilus assembly PilM family ATPase
VARQTLIDWQRDSLIVAVGQTQGTATSLDRVNVQPIGATSEEQESPARNADAAQALGRAVDELGLRKSDATVIVSREIVELRTLAIPRVDPHELPDIIRFQAQRQLANMGDNWALDYVLLPDQPGQEMLTALVGVLSPSSLSEIEAACTSAGLQLVNLALAPIEIARLAVV